MSEGCEICQRIARFAPDNPYLVAEMSTGYAVLADNQYCAGYTIFLAKHCVPELHDLPRDERLLFLDEMSLVAEAVFRAFSPRKLAKESKLEDTGHIVKLFPPSLPVSSPARFPHRLTARRGICRRELKSTSDARYSLGGGLFGLECLRRSHKELRLRVGPDRQGRL